MIKTNLELVKIAQDIATNYKTLYVKACFGAPMTNANKKRYINEKHVAAYNGREDRKAKIMAATSDTFGFDCICFVKGIFWGWTGDAKLEYGGAKYASNGVPDLSEEGMIEVCKDVSTDFSNVLPGEYLWMNGHAGIYIGNGLAVEATPSWEDGVQITAVHNIGTKSGYNGRKWTKHGKFPYITYVEEKKEPYTQKQFIKDVQKILGKPQTGTADAELLNATITISRTVNRKHALVKPIQKWLYALGYTQVGEADGSFGPATESAVIAFQKKGSGSADGEITAKQMTWKRLLNYTEAPKAEAPKPTTSTKPARKYKEGDIVSLRKGAKYTNNKTPQSWVYDAKLWVYENRDKDVVLVGNAKEDSIIGLVYEKDLTPYTNKSYKIKVINASLLNVRKGPGTNYAVVAQIKKNSTHTIVEEKSGWGRIDGLGWVSLNYTQKV